MNTLIAQATSGSGATSGTSPWTNCISREGIPQLSCIPLIFQNIVMAALIFASVVALFFILYAGFKYVTSGGDPKQVQSAQATLTYAIIGLIVILLSFFIISLIGYITGANCINQFGFDTCQ